MPASVTGLSQSRSMSLHIQGDGVGVEFADGGGSLELCAVFCFLLRSVRSQFPFLLLHRTAIAPAAGDRQPTRMFTDGGHA